MSDQLAILRPEGAQLGKMPQAVRVFGIDLGTTNSTVAEIVWNARDPGSIPVRCLEIDQPTAADVYTHLLVPSAVAIHGGAVLTRATKWAYFSTSLTEPLPALEKFLRLERPRQISLRRGNQGTPPPQVAQDTQPDGPLDFL